MPQACCVAPGPAQDISTTTAPRDVRPPCRCQGPPRRGKGARLAHHPPTLTVLRSIGCLMMSW